MTRPEEHRLIELALAGDRSAAEAFIRCHQQSLFAYILRLSGRPEVAEDIVQEAFVRALTNLHRFDHKFRFSTWLFTIAKRLYVNASQRLKPAYDTDIVSGREGGGARPWTSLEERETRDNVHDAVQAALMSLPEDQREIVILFHQHDWPISLIASHMEMPEGTVKSHLHRARRKMRDLLEHHEQYARSIQESWK